MKKIAVLRSNIRDAGSLKVLTALTNEFVVDWYVWDREGNYSPVFEHKNLIYKIFHIPSRSYGVVTLLKVFIFNVWLFYKLLFAKADFIHAIDLDTGLVGLFVAKIRNKHLVYHCLDPYHAALPPGWPEFLREFARKTENWVISQAEVFVITDLLRMPQHEGAKPKQVVEFANVPVLTLQEAPNKSDSDSFIVGYIGSLVEGRNLITIIEAIGELANEGVMLVIGGFGPLEQKTRAVTRKYNNITYTGFIPYSEVLRLESSFDLFIYITDSTNNSQKWVSPNKLFESMALGKPMIVGKGTLVAERVAMIGNGVTISYGSKEELKNVVLDLKSNPAFVKEMGEKGKEEFRERWSPVDMERRLLGAYRRLAP